MGGQSEDSEDKYEDKLRIILARASRDQECLPGTAPTVTLGPALDNCDLRLRTSVTSPPPGDGMSSGPYLRVLSARGRYRDGYFGVGSPGIGALLSLLPRLDTGLCEWGARRNAAAK
ncbi:hypothetical protein BaRGS_00027067 [Batillaria attramentaria]|uniref:Uncharacterized protein n=1 Tax=Batillaria attramentaria TaxID=370345 RepID=A0ABD0K3S1_9CAEN